MKLLNTAVIRLTLVFIIGVVAGFNFRGPLEVLYSATGCSLFFLIVSLLRSHKQLLQDILFGLSCLLLFFCLGMTSVQLHSPRNQPAHYSNLLSSQPSLLMLSIKESLKASKFNDRWVAEVKQIDGKKSFGKTILLLPKDSFDLKSDDLIACAAKPEQVPGNLNPQRFNYKKFLANRGILYQIKAQNHEILKLKISSTSLRGAAENQRDHIIAQLKKNPLGPEELAITQALLLGQRNEISSTTEEQYASAGVIHILAVSGLHVGIILLLLHSLLSPLSQWKYGKSLKIVLLIGLLWYYAMLAGLSPSIIRAVTMFSFLAIGMQLKRRTSALNSLFLSLLLLLLLNPHFLYEVGFQLSYTAVIAIVLLQPHLYGLFSFKGWLLDYLWKILTVSLAAQLGVLPLSLYYFHQFPGLFFVSNLVILPFLGVLLGFGMIILLLSFFNFLPTFLSLLYNFFIKSLNSFVAWVARQENFLLKDISYSLSELVAFYILLITLILFLHKKNPRRLSLLLGALLFLQGTTIYQTKNDQPAEVIVFHKTRHTIIGEQLKSTLKLAHNLAEPPEEMHLIKNFKLKKRLRKLQPENLGNLYSFPDGLLLVVDSSGIYRVPGLRPQRILLTNSPEINLERLLRGLKPKEVIADGSNYKSVVERWARTCGQNKIPFHYTGIKGAWQKRQ